MESDTLSRLEKQLGYQFKSTELLRQALSHRSVDHAHNERLEFLGDSILGFIIADEIYQRFPDASEGEMTYLRSNLVKGKTLAVLAQKLSLGEFLILGSAEMKTGVQRRESVLADAFEAILGGIYIESGIGTCRERLIDWYGELLSKADPKAMTKDAKTLLQEKMQSLKLPLPLYTTLKVLGKEHQRTFEVQCQCLGNNYSAACTEVAIASSRRQAEKDAAEKVLTILSHTNGHPNIN